MSIREDNIERFKQPNIVNGQFQPQREEGDIVADEFSDEDEPDGKYILSTAYFNDKPKHIS